ncbi:MAG: ATP-binding cassette domain-containing protein [Flavobacteriales bacterium]|nr:ATP-binding cassette domain-containing protein [Flavobacteriales bacterium]MCB9173503.1 ATP-binding cassette domain-containing protein [Flavobacteriales bacterium]
MIKIENLYKSFGSKKVLSNINLTFEEGKVYGIVGENGAGKTTLFNCITGIEKFDGIISANFNPLKDHIGYLQTEPFYFSKITGKEYIQLLCNARDKQIGNLEARNVFDLPLNQYANTYSTGMKKKLALMAILFQENEYLIFDEPFNGVDIQSNIIILDILKELKKLGKTIIISSHIFSTLNDICDEIHLMKDGQFIKKVYKDEFGVLEQEMKEILIGDKIAKLDLK